MRKTVTLKPCKKLPPIVVHELVRITRFEINITLMRHLSGACNTAKDKCGTMQFKANKRPGCAARFVRTHTLSVTSGERVRWSIGDDRFHRTKNFPLKLVSNDRYNF